MVPACMCFACDSPYATHSSCRADWPDNLEAQVAKAEASFIDVINETYQALLQTSSKEWSQGKISQMEFEVRKHTAHAESKAQHTAECSEARDLRALIDTYERRRRKLEKAEQALKLYARRICRESEEVSE